MRSDDIVMANYISSLIEKRRLRKWDAKRRELGYENQIGTVGSNQDSKERSVFRKMHHPMFPPLSTARALIIGSFLISASILSAAWICRPTRYQIVLYEQSLWRLDARTGAVVQCSTGGGLCYAIKIPTKLYTESMSSP